MTEFPQLRGNGPIWEACFDFLFAYETGEATVKDFSAMVHEQVAHQLELILARLATANETLLEQSRPEGPFEEPPAVAPRLIHKAEGVRLAYSYVEEALRTIRNDERDIADRLKGRG